MIGWDWRFQFGWGVIDLTVDPLAFMVGIAFGECDVMIRPIPFVLIGIEWGRARPA